MISFRIPYPPTVNTYYRNVQGKTLISAKGRTYRTRVQAALLEQLGLFKPLAGDLAITVDLFPPDRRRRDIDNVLKATLDSIQKANVVQDDSQFKQLAVHMHTKDGDGYALVHIHEAS